MAIMVYQAQGAAGAAACCYAEECTGCVPAPTATGLGAVAHGGSCVASGDAAAIAGGAANIASGDTTAVGGGSGNEASGIWATIAGGRNNEATANKTVISGGDANAASVEFATIGGGESNQCGALYGTIGGGGANAVWGEGGTVAGGDGNYANSDYSAVSGGSGNTTDNDYAAVPGGYGGWARNYGQVAHAAGSFATSGDAQGSIQMVARRYVASHAVNTWYPLYLDGAAEYMDTRNSSTWTVHILVVGQTTDSAQRWGYEIVGVAHNIAGTVTVDGQIVRTIFESDANYDAQIANNGADGLEVQVRRTGGADYAVYWVATIRTAEVVKGS